MKKLISIALGLLVMLSSITAFAAPNTDRNYTDEEIRLISRVVYAEARGESFEGKVAVACVVLNRIETSTKSVRKIVLKRGQFAVASKTNQECLDAVRYVIDNDIRALPTNVQYFKTSKKKWYKLNMFVKIGHHYFFMTGKEPVYDEDSAVVFNDKGDLVDDESMVDMDDQDQLIYEKYLRRLIQ